MKTRNLSDSESKRLQAGEAHYRAYVGPPSQYDLMGAMQFRLLSSLGLREFHKVLDFGCGSLRAGRMLIAYLQPECYYGVEPNRWLVDDAIERQLGQDIIRLKSPRISDSRDFSMPFRDVEFDFILAQSVFSHTGLDLMARILAEFVQGLSPTGIVAATFSATKAAAHTGVPSAGWVYPKCVRYQTATIIEAAEKVGLAVVEIPFFHPRQRWFLMSRERGTLPPKQLLGLLSGAVFNVEEFSDSLQSVSSNE